ncbi:MAG: hypothetical protein CMN30_08300 [Sandaracinus sp.]|nr:hypothetical protein [Sandaracinus sp.]
MTLGELVDTTVRELEKQAPDMRWEFTIEQDRPTTLLVTLYSDEKRGTKGRGLRFDLAIAPEDVEAQVTRDVASFRAYLGNEAGNGKSGGGVDGGGKAAGSGGMGNG